MSKVASTAAYISVGYLMILSLNVNLAFSLDFGKHFDGTDIPHDKVKLAIDMIRVQFNEMVKEHFDDAGGKFIFKSPAKSDYLYLIYDVAKPIGGYLGYIGEEPLSREELCRQLIGAGMGLAGSVTGASAGSYIGTMILPGWGTLVGNLAGSNLGYSYGKKFGIEVIGEICRDI